MPSIKKVLIANRGEIAVRVIRACRELGITTVAVYSEVDQKALHVLEADEAAAIGAAAPAESYLNIEKIIAAAQERQCDAIHPGYGFLSENAGFARRCREAGIIFIGPTPEAMAMVGDKLTARKTMREAGVPVTPGVALHTHDQDEIAKLAESIGYPVMIKASAGGGGKGMRVVRQVADLQSAIEAGQREALSAFGNDTVYMEKYLENPRHVEFQVLADQHGNIVHLFERECSIQRRHQKIIEETPSPALNAALRDEMGATACRVMEAVDYTNAGTVEFLLDQEKNYYFLEVNARIQVEHPITELVTGVDLVKQQIRIAEGQPLGIRQEDLRQQGHALECRIYAEDPENSFFPSLGKLNFVKIPQGPGIRCDSGIYSGMEVTMFYDPILAKLVVWAENRPDAIRKMCTALSDYVILGIKTPIPFLSDLLQHPEFVAGHLHTGFIDAYFRDWKPADGAVLREIALIAAAYAAGQKQRDVPHSGGPSVAPSPWQTVGEWEILSG